MFVSCRALNIDAKNPVLLSNTSAAFAELKNFAQALKDATACIAADPDFVKGYSRQGLAYSALMQPAAAEKSYRLGLKKDPNHAGLKQGLAAILQVGSVPGQCKLQPPDATIIPSCLLNSSVNTSCFLFRRI